MRMAGVAGDEHARCARPALVRQDVVEPVREAMGDLIHAVPGNVADIECVGVKDGVRVADDLFDGGAAHGSTVISRNLAKVHVHAEEVAAFAGDQQDTAACAGLDGAFCADVGEVRDGEYVHDPPRVMGLVAGHRAADRFPHLAPCAVRADHVLGPDNPLLALVGAGGMDERHGDRVLPFAHLEAAELIAVVGRHARWRVGHVLDEVVQHSGLVDDEVRELADACGVVQRAGCAGDAGMVGGVRLPERHFGDVVRLSDDPLREAEGLERLDAPGLDAVCLTDDEPPRAALHDTRGNARESGQLGGCEHARGAGAHNEHVNVVGKFGGPVQADAGGWLDPRVTGYVTVVMELHGLSSLRCLVGTSVR